MGQPVVVDEVEVLGELEVPFLRTTYNYDRDQVSFETGLLCEDASRTSQEFAEEVDINTIVEQFGLSGKLPQGLVMPVYGDFSGINDYHSAASAIAEANETFDQLPADIRSRFQNDPGQFVDFALDVQNRAQLEEWGMVNPQPVSPPALGGSGNEPSVAAEQQKV